MSEVLPVTLPQLLVHAMDILPPNPILTLEIRLALCPRRTVNGYLNRIRKHSFV